MAIDILTPRVLASAVALGGVITMMAAPEPSWHSVGIGLACLLAFGGLSLLSVLGPDQAEPRRTLIRPRKGRRSVVAHAERETFARIAPDDALLRLPPPRGLNDPHPALFKGLHVRRSGSSR